jgi:hypothetical protein
MRSFSGPGWGGTYVEPTTLAWQHVPFTKNEIAAIVGYKIVSPEQAFKWREAAKSAHAQAIFEWNEIDDRAGEIARVQPANAAFEWEGVVEIIRKMTTRAGAKIELFVTRRITRSMD